MSAKQSEAQDVRSLCTNPRGLHTGSFHEFYYHIVKSRKGKCTYHNLRFEEFFFHVCNFRMIMHFEKSTSVDYRAQVSRLYIELGRHMVCASLTQKFLNLLEQLKKALSSFHSFKISWCVSGSKFNEQIGKSSANR